MHEIQSQYEGRMGRVWTQKLIQHSSALINALGVGSINIF